MIWISRTSSGLLIQKDATEIAIDHAAISTALAGVIACLTDAGRARVEGYAQGHADGLAAGYAQAAREQTIREAKMADELESWGLAATLAA